MNVFYGATRNLYPYLKGAIRSLLDHNKDVKLFIFAEDNKLPYELPCEHEIINVKDQKYFGRDCPNINSQFTYMAMMRVCMPELLKVDKVISLDVDTIVCESLDPLWEIPLDNKWVAWCQEYTGSYKPFGSKYYNFGISVLNLEQMRKDNFTELAVYEINRKHLLYTDQDVMNMYAVPDKMVDIPVRYNECFCCGYTDKPAIVHYAGYRNWYENRNMFRVEYLDKYRGD